MATVFRIQDGGDRQYDIIDMFQVEVPLFPLILVTIGHIVKK